MKTKILITFLIFIQFHFIFSQNKPKPNFTNPQKANSYDCKKAISISVNTNTFYGPTVSPIGFGDIQEFTSNISSTFEGEHNSSWYLLSIGKEGQLIFDITPIDTTNDYDFLLYNYSDSTFCEDLQKGKLKPIRSNLSNIKKSKKGVTGLNINNIKNTIGEGIGEAYSKPLDVKKDEKYMLILDNVTHEGKGHSLFFNYIKAVEIKGKILGADSMPIIANITFSDNKGKLLIETSSNKDGDYKINTQVKENQNYNLTYEADNLFVQTAIINTKDLKGTSEFPDIKTVLPKIKKGEKYKLGNIYFFGNIASLLPESYASVEALYKLMSKNKKMVIQIQGHVNDPSKQKPDFDQTLSEDRANTIYNYLSKKGIDKKRMSIKGLSFTQMLFPYPANESEEQANRRVEIKVISIE